MTKNEDDPTDSESEISQAASVERKGRWMRFSIRGLLLVTTLIALFLAWPHLVVYLTPVVAFIVVFAMDGSVRCRDFGLVLAAVYVPAIQGFFDQSSHCRNSWPHLFPVAPGILPSVLSMRLAGFGRLDDALEFGIASLFVTCFVVLAYRMTRISALLTGFVLVGLGVLSSVSVNFLIVIMRM